MYPDLYKASAKLKLIVYEQMALIAVSLVETVKIYTLGSATNTALPLILA
jgi:hypothetical protein